MDLKIGYTALQSETFKSRLNRSFQDALQAVLDGSDFDIHDGECLKVPDGVDHQEVGRIFRDMTDQILSKFNIAVINLDKDVPKYLEVLARTTKLFDAIRKIGDQTRADNNTGSSVLLLRNDFFVDYILMLAKANGEGIREKICRTSHTMKGEGRCHAIMCLKMAMYLGISDTDVTSVLEIGILQRESASALHITLERISAWLLTSRHFTTALSSLQLNDNIVEHFFDAPLIDWSPCVRNMKGAACVEVCAASVVNAVATKCRLNEYILERSRRNRVVVRNIMEWCVDEEKLFKYGEHERVCCKLFPSFGFPTFHFRCVHKVLEICAASSIRDADRKLLPRLQQRSLSQLLEFICDCDKSCAT